MNPSALDWPPPFTIRRSSKSKRISMRISPAKGLEIILPIKEKEQKAIDFLNLKYSWVQKYRHILQPSQVALPNEVNLSLINENWMVTYAEAAGQNKLIPYESTQKILIKAHDQKNVIRLVKKWLATKAEKHLIPMLKSYSEQYDLPYSAATIRLQQTRWGSCSKDKRISLNCKLLLLPQEIVHYILVHELIHTIHFDHSPQFWSAVEKYVPDQLALRKQLKKIENQLPNWLY